MRFISENDFAHFSDESRILGVLRLGAGGYDLDYQNDPIVFDLRYLINRSGFLSESGEVSEDALPQSIFLHENVRSPFARLELFPQIVALGTSHCRDYGSVRVGAYSNILGVHGFVFSVRLILLRRGNVTCR